MDLNAINKLAIQMGKEMIEQSIEESENRIRNEERKIWRHKRTLKLLLAFGKELAKPPKPFKMPRPTKAQRKAMNRMPIGTRVYDAPIRVSPATSH